PRARAGARAVRGDRAARARWLDQGGRPLRIRGGAAAGGRAARPDDEFSRQRRGVRGRLGRADGGRPTQPLECAPAAASAADLKNYTVGLSGGAGAGAGEPGPSAPIRLSAEIPPMAPRFIDSSADEGTT